MSKPDCLATSHTAPRHAKKEATVADMHCPTSQRLAKRSRVLTAPLTTACADGTPLLAHLAMQLRGLQDANEHEDEASPSAQDLHSPT